MSDSKPETNNSSSLSSSSSQGGGGSFSAPPSNAKPIPPVPPHSAGYNSMGSVSSPSFHAHHQQQYGGSEIPPHSAPPQYPKHLSDQIVNHIVVSSSSQQQRAQNMVTSQGNDHSENPTGMQSRYSQQMARPSAPPPQERRELKQPSLGNNYAVYQNQPQLQQTQQQAVSQHNHYFQQQQMSKDTGGAQQHLGAQYTQRLPQQSELVTQQLGAPLPNAPQHSIQQSISAQNSSFQIQQQRPPPRQINSNQQHLVLPLKLSTNHSQQPPQLGSPLNQAGSCAGGQVPPHLYGPPAARSVVLSSAGSSTPHLSQTLSNDNSAAGSPAVHDHVYGSAQQHYQPLMATPHPPTTTTFVVQQGSSGQRIYIQQPQPAAHIIAAQQAPPPQSMPPGYNGSHRFYSNAVTSMAAAVGAAGVLSVDNNPKEKYRELKRKFKFLVYENEYYQEELRNLQRKLLKLSRDKNFLLDRLGNHENNSSDNSSDDSEASVKTLEDRVPKIKKKAKPTPARKKPAATSALNGTTISKRGSSTQLEIKTETPVSANNAFVKTEEAVNLATSQPLNPGESMECSANTRNNSTATIDAPNQFFHSNSTTF